MPVIKQTNGLDYLSSRGCEQIFFSYIIACDMKEGGLNNNGEQMECTDSAERVEANLERPDGDLTA